ncbi:MAG TPA: class I SAM-dependent methyltransferase [Gemmatimonadales bacterium]|nr:class I SAM-dependent methyltransferase [Gemmatimonadales bacterium]
MTDPIPGESLREDADIATSSEDYARRFAGDVGRWFLEIQSRLTLELLEGLPRNATVLDVGGGHAQITPSLLKSGYKVTVVGSHADCSTRLKPWIDGVSCRFEVADLRALPYEVQSFDGVVCLRLLPHSSAWTRLIGQLCRIARHMVLVDYPTTRSVNILSRPLFALKKGIERNTRSFRLFSPREIRAAFREHGFKVTAERPQFLFPMALHRLGRRAGPTRAVEESVRALGLTRWFGSPVLSRADRQPGPLTTSTTA